MVSVAVFFVPGGDTLDVDFDLPEGVDVSDMKSLCNNPDFIKAVEETGEVEGFALIPTMDEEGNTTDEGIVCVCPGKFNPEPSVGDKYDAVCAMRGKQKRDASDALKERVRRMNEIAKNYAVVQGLLSLIQYLDEMIHASDTPRYKRDKASSLLDSVSDLYQSIREKELLCDHVDVSGGRSVLTPSASTKQGFVEIETQYNDFMKTFYECCNSFVPLSRKTEESSEFSVGVAELELEVETLTQQTEEYEKTLEQYVQRDIKQKKQISDLEKQVEELEAELKEGKVCDKCSELNALVAELEGQLNEKEMRVSELESIVEEQEQTSRKMKTDGSEWERKYHELAAMYETMKQQVEQMKKTCERMPQEQKQDSEPDSSQPTPILRKNPFPDLGPRPKM